MENLLSSKESKSPISKIFSFRTVLVLFFAACISCAIPLSRNAIIALMQLLLHRSLRNFEKWDNILLHTMLFFAAMTAFLYFFMYIKKGKEIFCEGVKLTKEIFTQKNAVRNILIIAGVLFVSYWALIRTSYDYADDMRRVYSGHKAWIGWNHFISESLAVFLHTNFFINDIAPLTHIWTIAILTVTAYLLANLITDRKITILTLFASAFFAITPFYNSNFAYKFDCPYMAIAMLFGIIPFFFAENTIHFVIMSVFSILIMCTSYQAANSIYIILAIFVTLKMALDGRDKKKIFIFVAAAILCYAVTLGLFRNYLMNTFERDPILNHSSQMSETIVATLIANLKAYFSMLIAGYGNIWIKFFTILSIVLFPISSLKISKINRALTLLLSITALALMVLLSFGCYLVLANPIIQYRAFMGFDIFISVVSIFNLLALGDLGSDSAGGCKILRKINIGIVLCLTYGFIVSSNVFGNFYDKQQDYEHFRMTILLEDLSRFIKEGEKADIFIGGNYGQVAKSRMEKINYNLTAGNSSGLTEYLIKDWNMNVNLVSEVPLFMIDRVPQLKEKIESLPLLVDTYYHTIYGENNFYYIYLKHPEVDGD